MPDAPTVGVFEAFILNTLLAAAIIPLVTLATARAGFGDEIGDRTLANVTLTPYPRWKIVLPKLLGVTCVPVLVIAATAFLTSYVAYGADFTATWAVTTGAVTAVVLYSSLFVWLDLVTPHAVGVGLAYIVVWEGLFSRFIYGVRFLSLRSYSLDELGHAWHGRASLSGRGPHRGGVQPRRCGGGGRGAVFPVGAEAADDGRALSGIGL